MVTPSSAPSVLARVSAPGPSRRLAKTALAIALSLAATIGLERLTAPPGHVARISVTNDTGYDLQVFAGTPGAPSVVPLGAVGKASTADLAEVLDLGSSWVVSFRAQGRDGGSLEIARDDLERDGWRLVVPAAAAARLDDAGAPPSP